MFEGDIIGIPKGYFNRNKTGQSKAAAINFGNKWLNGIVPYTIDSAFSNFLLFFSLI